MYLINIHNVFRGRKFDHTNYGKKLAVQSYNANNFSITKKVQDL